MLDKYRDYFDIDPEYLAQINEAEIESHPDLWKKFYPHETFVKLVKDTISVISRKQKLSIWVEGAYGTGKSHAVLTLKNCWTPLTKLQRHILINTMMNSAQIFTTNSNNLKTEIRKS